MVKFRVLCSLCDGHCIHPYTKELLCYESFCTHSLLGLLKYNKNSASLTNTKKTCLKPNSFQVNFVPEPKTPCSNGWIVDLAD